MSKIIDERPLLVLPALAVQVGLNESIFIQQLHFWLTWLADAIEKKQIKIEDRWEQDRIWIRNSNPQWRDQFPFWSLPTIKRIIRSSKQFGVLTIQSSDDRWDKTNLYSLDYEILRKLNIYAMDQIDPIERVRLISSMGPTRSHRTDQIDPNIIQRHYKDTSIEQPAAGGKKAAAGRLKLDEIFPELVLPGSVRPLINAERTVGIFLRHRASYEQAQHAIFELAGKLQRCHTANDKLRDPHGYLTHALAFTGWSAEAEQIREEHHRQ